MKQSLILVSIVSATLVAMFNLSRGVLAIDQLERYSHQIIGVLWVVVMWLIIICKTLEEE